MLAATLVPWVRPLSSTLLSFESLKNNPQIRLPSDFALRHRHECGNRRHAAAVTNADPSADYAYGHAAPPTKPRVPVVALVAAPPFLPAMNALTAAASVAAPP